MRKLVVMGVFAMVAGASASCNQGVECGDGTMLVDGVCEIAIAVPMECRGLCGPNTTYDATLQACVGDATVMCDPDSTSEVLDPDTGIATCFGEVACGRIQCPVAAPGRVNVCGQLLDLETSARIDLGDGGLCDPANPATDGPCALELTFYDALAFAQNPTGATPLPYDRLRINECGYYAAEGIPAPALGYLGIGVDDAVGPGDHELTGVAIDAGGGDVIDNFNVYAARISTVEMWTDSASMPFGSQTFADRGVYAPIYLHCGQPVPGVTVLEAGSPTPTTDYYYSDVDPFLRTTVDPAQSTTGTNGSALVVDSDLVSFTGSGGDIGACRWPSLLGDAIPGVVFAQELHSLELDSEERCACP